MTLPANNAANKGQRRVFSASQPARLKAHVIHTVRCQATKGVQRSQKPARSQARLCRSQPLIARVPLGLPLGRSPKKVERAVRASHAGACQVHRQLQLLSVLHVLFPACQIDATDHHIVRHHFLQNDAFTTQMQPCTQAFTLCGPHVDVTLQQQAW